MLTQHFRNRQPSMQAGKGRAIRFDAREATAPKAEMRGKLTAPPTARHAGARLMRSAA